MEEKIVSGCVKAILEEYAEPLVKKLAGVATKEWEKFKIDFDIAFLEYLKKSHEKYSKIKTILYKTEPKDIYDFFECPILSKGSNKYSGDDIKALIELSNFLIIQGSGGIGKSTLMKYLFLKNISKRLFIPVFIELKDLNDIKGDYSIYDFIFERLNGLGSTLDKKYLDYALSSGCFMFFLDGYDEIITERKDDFFRKFNLFCDKYSENYYIISSRPYSEFVEFQRFTVLDVDALSKEQAVSLINKIDYDENTKERFVKELNDNLYESHKSFASNPLLLNIMLLTFDNYAEIPKKLHLFYEQAFETLYYKHDANKGSYRRELRSALTYDCFKRAFSLFCFISYFQGKIEFSTEDLKALLSKAKVQENGCKVEDYIYDLVNSICVLHRDGLNYKFTHRSFQEYFTALFLKELSDEKMQQFGIKLIEDSKSRIIYDNVFKMLHDMTEIRMEQNILLPVLKKIEQECTEENKYDFYVRKLNLGVRWHKNRNGELSLYYTKPWIDDMMEFVFDFSFIYQTTTEKDLLKAKTNSDKLMNFLIDHRHYHINTTVNIADFIDDDDVYVLIKKTRLGEQIEIISQLSETIAKKKKENELDLNEFIV